MFSRQLLACLVSVLLPSLACSPTFSQGEAKVSQVKGSSYTLDIIDNSETFSHALDINSTGQMIGVREVADESGAIFQQESFFVDGKKTTKLPLLEGFTSIDMAALSDTGRVVGYASRPIGHPEGSLIGIVWDAKTGKLTRLPPVAGDLASHAQDISADGTRISGYSSGFAPPRLRPCLWTWNDTDQAWGAEALPVIQDYNPYIMSSSVIISPDGKRVAACITFKEYTNSQFDSSLYMWNFENGKWNRELVSDEQMFLRGINNSGQIVGIYSREERHLPCLIDLKGELTILDLLPGDVSGEARAINAEGTIVGFSDDPTGPQGGPQAVVWQKGKTSPLELPQGTTYSSAFGINAQGQIAGMLDVEQETKSKNVAGQEETDVKTLAFRWNPTQVK